MNFSFMTVSFPVDKETYAEMKALCETCYVADHLHYESILNIPVAQNYEAQGFFVLVYNDEDDQLVGLASAIDMMGLNTFEWSILIAPMYRRMGLGDAVYGVIQDGLEVRASNGDLALMMEGMEAGRLFLNQRQYAYSFSEATLEAHAEQTTVSEGIIVRPFEMKDMNMLINIFCEAFGDTAEEAQDLIAFNTQTEGLVLWVAETEGEVAGTVTTRKDAKAQWVSALAVHPEKSGQGIGTALLNSVKQLAYTGEENVVLLDVEIDNNRALAVYEKAGFTKLSQIDYFAKQ